MTRLSCDGPTLIRSVAAAVANLERHVAEVDALNVFPVPDGDTGSNMLATLRAALAEAERLRAEDRQLGRVADAMARGAIRGARGNSGVILAEIIRGMTSGVDGRHRATGIELAAGLRRATESAYGSVLEPVEGTILTVIRDAAEAAETEATRDRHVERVLSAAVVGAARSVDRTPGLLAVLADAGVVDSGGQGLLRILEGTLLLDGSERRPATLPPFEASAASARVTPDIAPTRLDGHFGYETVYVVESPDGGLDVETLRTELHTLGDSIVVAGDRRLARVHIHGPRPDLAIAVGLRLGRISDVSITDLDADAAGARHEAPAGAGHAPTVPLGLVAFADADGGASLLARIQVGGVVRPAAGRPPSAVEVAAAVAATHGRHVLVLVRDADDAGALDEALALVPGVEVTTVPVGDIAGAVAAALAFDPNAPASENAERMGAEARRLRRVELGSDEAVDVVIERMRALEGDGIEVATVYAGDRLPPTVEDALRAAIVAAWPGLEIDVVFAGQHGDSALVALD